MSKLNAAQKRLMQTLNSQEFAIHIYQTFGGMPPEFYKPLLKKLTFHVRQGDREKWCGMSIDGLEFRVGYGSNGSCYTQFLDGADIRCYDFHAPTITTSTN
jgi:hypothetical protein